MSKLFRWQGSSAGLSRSRIVPRSADRSTSADDARSRADRGEIVRRVRNGGDARSVALATELDGVSLCSARGAARAFACARSTSLDAAGATRARARRREHRVGASRISAARVGDRGRARRHRRPSPRSARLRRRLRARRARGVSELACSWARSPRASRECSASSSARRPEPTVSHRASCSRRREIAGVNEVYAIGGAGAIAAMAYGTASIAPVRRIVGPGNAYVAEAKLQVSGVIGHRFAGGTERAARDRRRLRAAQSPSRASCSRRRSTIRAPRSSRSRSSEAIARAIGDADRDAAPARAAPRDHRRSARESRGAILLADSLERAIAFSNEYAPEHLLLALRDPDAALERVRNAGTVFLGDTTSVAFGDYMTGANHVLPTGGLARSYSGLSTLDFVRWTTYQRVSPARGVRSRARAWRRSPRRRGCRRTRRRRERAGQRKRGAKRERTRALALRARAQRCASSRSTTEPRAVRARSQRQHESLGRAAVRRARAARARRGARDALSVRLYAGAQGRARGVRGRARR